MLKVRRDTLFIRHQASGQEDKYKLEEIISVGGKMKKKLNYLGYTEQQHCILSVCGAGLAYFWTGLWPMYLGLQCATMVYLFVLPTLYICLSKECLRWYNRAFV